MSARISMVGITELALIAALSSAGAYAFLSSNIYVEIERLMHAADRPVAYVPLILLGVPFLYGVLSITIRGRSSGGFIFLVFLLSLPAVLSYNIVDWPGIVGIELTLSTSLGFYAVLALGVFMITGYVLLNRMHVFRHTQRNLAARGADPVETEAVTFNTYLVSILAILVVLVVAAAIAFMSRSLALLTIDHVREIPWHVILIGIGCVLVLAGYLRWLGIHRRTKE